jgi:anti-sigma factor RsiW
VIDALQHAEAADLLAAYVGGTLPVAQRDALTAHVQACPRCVQELGQWSLLRQAAQAALPPVAPDARLLAEVVRQVQPVSRWSPRRLVGLIRAQVPLVRQQIWTASALVMSLGLVTVLLGRGGASLLELLAPVVAAAGIAFLYGPEQDPSLELALATPTSPRLVLLARLTLVFGYDLALGLLVSLALALAGQAPDGLWQLILQWLGPMLLLSAISLWISQGLGVLPATFVPLTLWAVKVALVGVADQSSAALRLVALIGTTNGISMVIALALTALVLFSLPGQERVACA